MRRKNMLNGGVIVVALLVVVGGCRSDENPNISEALDGVEDIDAAKDAEDADAVEVLDAAEDRDVAEIDALAEDDALADEDNVEDDDIFSVDGDIQVSGSVNQDEVVTIVGSGFGSGPNIVIYDDFEGGSHDDPIALDSPVIGTWSAKSEDYIARYHRYAYSGQTSFSMQDDLAEEARYGGKPAMLKSRFEDTQEVFLSYQLAVPPGKFFPGAPTREQWGTASHWKMTWLMDTDSGYGHADGLADLCVPTNGQAQALQIVGNTDKIGWVASLDELFDIDGFNRVAVWLKADPSAPQTEGYTWIQWLSAKSAPAFTRVHDMPVFNGGATTPTSAQWNQLNVPGWFGNSLVNPGGVYDDVYLATGPSAAARVEVGDAPVYADCTELSIMPSISWTDSEIKVRVKTKGTQTISQKYIFIFDAQNELIAEGIAIP